MSNYTIKLKSCCDLVSRNTVESYFTDYELSDFLTPKQINVIENAGIWNKEKLAKKIVDHYFYREIGFETLGIFKHFAKVKMQELMEQKLPLIYSNCIEYDPLINVDYTESFERNVDAKGYNQGNSNSNSNSNSNGLNINNDTPQTNVNKQDINSGIYASNVGQSNTESNIADNTITNSNSTNNSIENYKKSIKGNSGVAATSQKMVEQFRQNIVSIDKDIINNLNDLFFGLY